MRNAVFLAESISITCPYCGAPKPNSDGGDQWLPSELRAVSGLSVVCNDCDETFMITQHNKANIVFI